MIEISYKGKKHENQILRPAEGFELACHDLETCNQLIHGENLTVLRELLFKHELRGKVDLVYIDPPFATKTIFSIGEDRVRTISGSKSDREAYSDTLVGEEFLEFLRERLTLLRELLAPTGSIYLHIDYKIGHYVKMIMDDVFGADNFRNDISRIKCNPKNFARKGYGNIKDMILFYTKSENATWNEPFIDYKLTDAEKLFPKTDKNGRRYTTVPLHAPGETNGATAGAWRGIFPPKGRHWRSAPEVLENMDREGLIEWSRNDTPRKKIFLDEQKGKRLQDIWEYKDPQYPIYPTEKNSDMLETIIKTSSNEGDLVMDCFCGSGSTLLAAQKLGRRWIGIDQSVEAIKVSQKRLDSFGIDLFSNPNAYLLSELKKTKQRKLTDNISEIGVINMVINFQNR